MEIRSDQLEINKMCAIIYLIIQIYFIYNEYLKMSLNP
jgi:hypothetical protein